MAGSFLQCAMISFGQAEGDCQPRISCLSFSQLKNIRAGQRLLFPWTLLSEKLRELSSTLNRMI
jgi:hypothetical protein